MLEINAGDEALACYVSLECCHVVPETEKAIPAMVSTISGSAARSGIPVPPSLDGNPTTAATLCVWSGADRH